jgi:hypothetical protein
MSSLSLEPAKLTAAASGGRVADRFPAVTIVHLPLSGRGFVIKVWAKFSTFETWDDMNYEPGIQA